MQKLFFVFTLILSIQLCAQNELENTKIFVRVYDLNGKKISKGKILSISETSMELNSKEKSIRVPLTSIGLIKTKHSIGNNIILGAATGATAIGIIGAASADPDTSTLGYSSTEGAAIGAAFGGALGAAIGGMTILFKNSKSYKINGDKTKWIAFKELINNK